ncbi:Hsp70 family protein [Desulfoluna sp.]|uniref:Hsp70 family protein n=1 Tax=Desulfoluna sp. TaxID=2045199 RepID=UPI00262450CC|nr:Hsp70 family protein [Desulfoluna sp.]
MSVVFGLDFGTSNSALSANIDGNVSMIDIDGFNETGNTLKSVIYYDDEERQFFSGQEAVNQYIENDAFGRYIQSIKSFLPDASFEKTEVGNKTYTLEQLIGMILRTIRERGEKAVGKAADCLVLGRPVVFSEDPECEALANRRLLKAAELAGFKEVHLQLEPIAAALAYENTLKNGEEKTVLVGDFGGGTSDFTIIKARGGQSGYTKNRKEDVLGLGGIYIGGDTFDSAIMWNKVAPYFGKEVRVKALYDDFTLPVSSLILGKLKQWHLIPHLRHPKIEAILKDIHHRADKPKLIENLQKLIEDNYGYLLFRAIEETKCRLSTDETALIRFNEGSLAISEPLPRSEFEGIINANVTKIDACVDEVMTQAGLTPDQVDTVFLTGGSSHILKIRELFIKRFGAEKIDAQNAFTSVAYGLGCSQYLAG